jgi:hypothetical protein
VGAKDNKGNGLLEVHHELVELLHQESDLKAQLHQVQEKRGALEQMLKAAPAPSATRPRVWPGAARAGKAPKPHRATSKATGAPALVEGALRASGGSPVSTKKLRAQFPKLKSTAIHNALSAMRRRGKAANKGAGLWAWVA